MIKMEPTLDDFIKKLNKALKYHDPKLGIVRSIRMNGIDSINEVAKILDFYSKDSERAIESLASKNFVIYEIHDIYRITLRFRLLSAVSFEKGDSLIDAGFSYNKADSSAYYLKYDKLRVLINERALKCFGTDRETALSKNDGVFYWLYARLAEANYNLGKYKETSTALKNCEKSAISVKSLEGVLPYNLTKAKLNDHMNKKIS